MQLIPRPQAMQFLKTWQDRPLIKVVSGVRRCGKSTLFALFQNELRQQGVPDARIIRMNFERPELMNIDQPQTVYEYLKPKLQVKGMKYVFLDEIQHVQHFEKLADALYVLPDVDLYLTGSNGYFMSGELATLLTGRYVELKLLPLSFKEYVAGFKQLYSDQQLTNAQLFNQYLRYGSFPYVLQLVRDPVQVSQYLDGIFSSIVYRDVQTRLQVSDRLALQRIINFVVDNIGSLLSMRKIANTLTSSGFKISAATVERYLAALLDSLLIYRAARFDIHGKEQLRTNDKYYVVDPGLKHYLLAGKKADSGHLLENIVYLELLRRGGKVDVGALPNGEIDFVTRKGSEIAYYQVSQSVLDQGTLARELRPLSQLKDHYPKYLLTLDEIGAGANYEGIQQLNVIDWLLQ